MKNNSEPKDDITPWAFIILLLLAPLLPFAILVARDYGYAALEWANTETPQGALTAWEVWLIAAVCWATAVAVGLIHWRKQK